MKLKNTDLITVCDNCLMACCWMGELMCWESDIAGTTQLTVAELKKLNSEHPSYWERSKNGN